MLPLILTVALLGQADSWYMNWHQYPYPSDVRPHTIEIRAGFDAWVKQMEPANKRILAELNDGEIVYLAYGKRTRFFGRPQPGDHIWVDTARYTVTIIDEIPPLILEERR